MLAPLARYFWREVIPRTGRIVANPACWISFIAGFSFGNWGDQIFKIPIPISTVASVFLSYAAVALGFLVTGFTLILTLPNDRFTSNLAISVAPGSRFDAYSNLLFVFSWSAFWHWMLIMSMVLLLFCNPTNKCFFDRAMTTADRWGAGLSFGVITYCLCLFLIVIITLYQVAYVYINFLKAEAKKKGTSHSAAEGAH